MIRVIINADDCGNNPTINKAIDEALSLGAISSTTIMANSQYLREVHAMVKKYPKASFGIHLNLTEGPAFTQPQIFRDKGIIDENGYFVHGNSKRCANPSSELKEAIFNEWDAQFAHLVNDGFVLSHVDGHHHCHTWPGLDEILVRVMKKYNMKKVRNRYHRPLIGFKEHIVSGIKHVVEPIGNNLGFKRLIDHTSDITYYRLYNRAIAKNNLVTTTYFQSYQAIIPIINNNCFDNCSIELMCHPGLFDYADEMDAILHDAIDIKNNNSIHLISYKEL